MGGEAALLGAAKSKRYWTRRIALTFQFGCSSGANLAGTRQQTLHLQLTLACCSRELWMRIACSVLMMLPF